MMMTAYSFPSNTTMAGPFGGNYERNLSRPQGLAVAMQMVYSIYEVTQTFPKHELYGLVSQMRRAAVSVPSNIAEGKGRSTRKDMSLFLCHSRGSLLELETQLLIAEHLGYLTKPASTKLFDLCHEVGRMLNGLIGYATA